MFYYISFLRPPPLQASIAPSEPILITPQICNDLRTEYFQEPADIYYSWSLESPNQPTPVITKPVKLTSWRSNNAYKEISVPRPQNLRGGQSWRLILSCGMTRKDQIIALDEQNIGSTPLAVVSMPVTFISRPQKGTKQEQITRSYFLRASLQQSPVIFDIVEQTSFDLDKKIWDSGIGLSSWLVQLYAGKLEATVLLSDLRESLFSRDNRNIVELGAGTGVVAITLGILRSKLDISGQTGHIVTTDLPSAIPILESNIASSRAFTSRIPPEAAVLDWESKELTSQVQLDTGLDAIIMADVTYNTSSFPALIGTLSRLIEFSKSKRNGRQPMILLGYKERHVDERSLWERVKEINVHFEKVGEAKGAGGNPVEVWVG
ncbi:putative methyltransferase-domain-containing protein [Melanogaster broomeanus]|nr:putative methyltransferase-domain-containing protein [Melanogaster broomeanus]